MNKRLENMTIWELYCELVWLLKMAATKSMLEHQGIGMKNDFEDDFQEANALLFAKINKLSEQCAKAEAMVKSADEKLENAGNKVGLNFGCDTAEVLADTILDYRQALAETHARLSAYEASK